MPNEELHMKKTGELLGRLWREDEGGEVLEYALIASLIVAAAAAAITTVGNHVFAKWTSLQNST